MRTLMACSHGTIDPASRFRVLQFIPSLEKAGWQVSHRPNNPARNQISGLGGTVGKLLTSPIGKWMRQRNRLRDLRDAPGFDAVFLNRDLLAGDVIWEQRLIRQNPKVVFDFDDAIFLGEKKREHIAWICGNAAGVTAGNEYLADFARQFTPNVTVLPSVVDTGKYVVKDYSHLHDGPLRLGWMGSGHSIRQTLFPHLSMLAKLQQEFGFEFIIVSNPKPKLPQTALRWKFIQWSPKLEAGIGNLIDIGIMPLIDDAFQQGKCGLKLLQYMAGGLPVIASPVGINRSLVYGNGYLATSGSEWHQAIKAFDTDRKLLRDFGLAGRLFCKRHYDLQSWAGVLNRLLETVADNR